MQNKQISSSFVVVINSKKEIEYLRDRQLSIKQSTDLEKMDSILNQGLTLDGQTIASPSNSDKAIFIANELYKSLIKNNDAMTALTCAYLATRYQDLKQLKITTHENRVSLELINDREYSEQAPLKFIAKKDLTTH